MKKLNRPFKVSFLQKFFFNKISIFSLILVGVFIWWLLAGKGHSSPLDKFIKHIHPRLAFLDKSQGTLNREDLKRRIENLTQERDRLELKLNIIQARLKKYEQEKDASYPDTVNLSESIPAKIVSFDPAGAEQTLWVDQGGLKGVDVGDPVVAAGALVGRVVKVKPEISQVLLITDLRSVVSVRDVSTQAHGILVGKRFELHLDRTHWLTQGEYFEAKEEINRGDLLVSSGLDQLFPEGIPVGKVRELKKDTEGLFWQATVEPLADIKKISAVVILHWEDNLENNPGNSLANN